MSKIKEFQQKLKQRTKFEVIKSLFQALTVTVVAVVAVTVFVPNSPKANFDEIKAFSHEIIYQVNISDADNIVETDKLKLILESQFGETEKQVTVGQNYGSFTELDENTLYKLKVVYDKGFGEEVLAIETINTTDELIAVINNVELLDTSNEYYLNYDIGILYGEIEGYSDWQVRYAYIYQDSIDEPYYETYLLNNLENNLQLQFYNSSEVEFEIILEAMFEGNVIVVDEVRIKPPFSIYAYLYLSRYNDTEAIFNIYTEVESSVEILFQMEVYLNGILERKVDYEFQETQGHSGSEFVIDKLKPDSDYQFLFKGWYINPDTLREEHMLLGEETIHTLEPSTTTIDIVENTTFYQVSITTTSDVFNQAFYRIYYYETDYWVYLLSETITLLENGETYRIEFIIDKVSYEEFYIEIGIENSTDYEQSEILRKIES